MYLLYEDDGDVKAGRILSENEASLQVEAASGKRSKIKRANAFFAFDGPEPDVLMEQARAMAGQPLGSTQLLCPAVMLNVLGDVWFADGPQAREPDWSGVLAVPGVKLHLYGKREARRGRKMGHVTRVKT